MSQNVKSKFGWKSYFNPTPKRFRVAGDSLAAAATFGASIAVLNGHPYAGTVILIIGVVGKFISNFFSDEAPSD
jgi:hypothetical protein